MQYEAIRSEKLVPWSHYCVLELLKSYLKWLEIAAEKSSSSKVAWGGDCVSWLSTFSSSTGRKIEVTPWNKHSHQDRLSAGQMQPRCHHLCGDQPPSPSPAPWGLWEAEVGRTCWWLETLLPLVPGAWTIWMQKGQVPTGHSASWLLSSYHGKGPGFPGPNYRSPAFSTAVKSFANNVTKHKEFNTASPLSREGGCSSLKGSSALTVTFWIYSICDPGQTFRGSSGPWFHCFWNRGDSIFDIQC